VVVDAWHAQGVVGSSHLLVLARIAYCAFQIQLGVDPHKHRVLVHLLIDWVSMV
jgi:hypothetical protein